LKEKDLALAIANAVASSLQANGISTEQTRTGDVVNAGTKLQWRLDIGKGADIYASIRIDASTSAKPNGFKFYYNGSGKDLAETISKANPLFQEHWRGSVSVLHKQIQGPSRSSRSWIHLQRVGSAATPESIRSNRQGNSFRNNKLHKNLRKEPIPRPHTTTLVSSGIQHLFRFVPMRISLG